MLPVQMFSLFFIEIMCNPTGRQRITYQSTVRDKQARRLPTNTQPQTHHIPANRVQVTQDLKQFTKGQSTHEVLKRQSKNFTRRLTLIPFTIHFTERLTTVPSVGGGMVEVNQPHPQSQASKDGGQTRKGLSAQNEIQTNSTDSKKDKNKTGGNEGSRVALVLIIILASAIIGLCCAFTSVYLAKYCSKKFTYLGSLMCLRSRTRTPSYKSCYTQKQHSSSYRIETGALHDLHREIPRRKGRSPVSSMITPRIRYEMERRKEEASHVNVAYWKEQVADLVMSRKSEYLRLIGSALHTVSSMESGSSSNEAVKKKQWKVEQKKPYKPVTPMAFAAERKEDVWRYSARPSLERYRDMRGSKPFIYSQPLPPLLSSQTSSFKDNSKSKKESRVGKSDRLKLADEATDMHLYQKLNPIKFGPSESLEKYSKDNKVEKVDSRLADMQLAKRKRASQIKTMQSSEKLTQSVVGATDFSLSARCEMLEDELNGKNETAKANMRSGVPGRESFKKDNVNRPHSKRGIDNIYNEERQQNAQVNKERRKSRKKVRKATK